MIDWDDSFSVGISIIDEQHKKLINIINKTTDMVRYSSDPEEILEILDEMTEYAKEHFLTEEAYMLKFRCPGYTLHKEEHFNFSNKTINYRNKITHDDSQIACEILEFLKKWLVDHILVTDKEYIDCFKKNGLK